MTIAAGAEALLAAAATYGPAEVFATREHRRTRRWHDGRLRADSVARAQGWSLRLRVGGRVGFAAATSAPTPDDLVARAVAAARVGPSAPASFATPDQPAWGPGISPLPQPGEIEDVVARVTDALTQDRAGAGASIAVTEVERQRVVLTSEGANATASERHALIRVTAPIVMSDEFLDLDRTVPWPAGVGEVDDLIRWFTKRVHWIERDSAWPAGDPPVLLTPNALAALIVFPLTHALAGPALLDGTSPLANPPDDLSIHPVWSVWDDPHRAGAPRSRAFDDEGVPTRRHDLVASGSIQGCLLDLATAHRLHGATTGSAWRTWDAWPEPQPSTVVVEGGAESFDDLLAGFPRVVLVDDVSCEWLADAAGGSVSATTSRAVLFERGEPAGSVSGAALEARLGDLLSQAPVFTRECQWVDDRAVLPYAYLPALTAARGE